MPIQIPTPIPIKKAFELLQIGATKGYELVSNGRLRTYRIGDRRFTTPEAISKLIADSEAEATAARSGECVLDVAPQRRGLGSVRRKEPQVPMKGQSGTAGPSRRSRASRRDA